MQTAVPSNRWLVLAILLLIYILSFADRYLMTGLVGPIKAEFSISDSVMGLLMGPAFVLLYVVMGVPIARLADRVSRVRIIAAGAIFWSTATIVTGLSTEVWMLALARVAVGVGEAAFVAPAYSLLSDYFKPAQRGMAFAVLGLATYFGQIAGQAGGPAVAAVHSWHIAFIAFGVPGIVLGLLVLLLIREPVRTGLPVGVANVSVPLGELVRRLARARSFVLMAFAFGLGAMSGIAFGYWGPELYARSFALDPVTVKTTFAINFGLAGLCGMLGFGAVSDRLSRRDPAWAARLAAFALGSATLAILAAVWAPSFKAAGWLAIPAGLLGGGWSVGLYSALQYILPSRFRASGTALFVVVTTLLGYFVAPWATGAVSTALGGDAQSLRVALSIIIPCGFVAALLAWFACPLIERDREQLALDH